AGHGRGRHRPRRDPPDPGAPPRGPRPGPQHARRLEPRGHPGDHRVDPDDELVQAVRTAAAGGTYLNPRLGAALAAAPPAPTGPPDDLTEREAEVLRLIALGHTTTEIAGML